jgi:hypothetical protein
VHCSSIWGSVHWNSDPCYLTWSAFLEDDFIHCTLLILAPQCVEIDTHSADLKLMEHVHIDYHKDKRDERQFHGESRMECTAKKEGRTGLLI